MGRQEQVRIRLTDEELRALDGGAERFGFSRSEAVRQAIREWLEANSLPTKVRTEIEGQGELL